MLAELLRWTGAGGASRRRAPEVEWYLVHQFRLSRSDRSPGQLVAKEE
jgi:hypothetical protein